jgi:polo-like kinase 1
MNFVDIAIDQIIIDPATKTEYKRGKKLGEGRYCRCFLFKQITNIKQGQNVHFAGKVIPITYESIAAHESAKNARKTEDDRKNSKNADITPASMMRCFSREVELLTKLEHPHIVRVEAAFRSNHFAFIIEELCYKPTFAKMVASAPDGRLEEHKCRKYMRQLIQTVMYLHEMKIMHRDLKLSNLFFSYSADRARNKKLKIGDFGLAYQVTSKEQRLHDRCGTPKYIAPEVVLPELFLPKQVKGYGMESDIWSLGICMFTMIYGVSPFMASTQREIWIQMQEKKITFPEHIKVSTDARNLMERLLEFNCTHRISLESALAHPFINIPNGQVH